MHFQKAGHKPIALVGGATGMIGDPSGKSAERNLLDEEALNKNVAGVKSQLERFLDFNGNTANAAELVNNYDWMKEFSLIDFVRDIGNSQRLTVGSRYCLPLHCEMQVHHSKTAESVSDCIRVS